MVVNVLAFILSTLTGYALNVLFVFKTGRHHRLMEMGLFYLSLTMSLIVGTALMGYLVRRFRIRSSVALVINLAVSLPFNFLARKFLIFNG